MKASPIRSLLWFAIAVLALFTTLIGSSPVLAQSSTSPQALTSGVAVSQLSGSSGSTRHFVLSVPAGTTQASFVITGSSGDADIYVRFGSPPTTSTWNYRPYLSSSNETVNVTNPAAGNWYVMIRAYTSYSGVTLKATHNGSTGGGTTPVAATPSFSPAPGTHSGQVSVTLASSTPGAVIRFTLDGSTPTTGSEVYVAPIVVTSTTQIRAAAFANGYETSTVASGTYTIANTVQALANNTPVSNLSGAAGSTANYKFAVPSGAVSATFTISGGSGDADLYVKYGQLATTSVWDWRPYLDSNNETVTITNPAAGDYFVMLRGYASYSGVTLKASWSGTATAGKPDLVAWGAAANPTIVTQSFTAGSCEIEEGTIPAAGTYKLLRFATQTRNIGTADLVLGNPANNPSFEWGACHGHYHFRSFAQYRLLDSTGSVVRTGRKVGFCLMDITRIDSAANPSPRYSCSSQGIQAGWADVYGASLSGQWIDITGVPAGSYQLEIAMDPMNVIDEADETNNITRIAVTIP
jgi:hypothetical protein